MLESSIWNNADIMTKDGSVLFDKASILQGFTKLKHFMSGTGVIKPFSSLVAEGYPKGKFLTWLSITQSIPQTWKTSFSELNCSTNLESPSKEHNGFTRGPLIPSTLSPGPIYRGGTLTNQQNRLGHQCGWMTWRQAKKSSSSTKTNWL